VRPCSPSLALVGLVACRAASPDAGGSGEPTGTGSASGLPSTSSPSTSTGIGDEDVGAPSTSDDGGSAVADVGDESTTGAAVSGPAMLYVTSGTRIEGWRIDLDDGALRGHVELELGGGELGPLTHDRAGTRLYVGRWDDLSISTLAIDPESGALTELDEISVDGAPVYLTLDHEDRHLLLADCNNDRVSSHALADDGTLVDPPSAILAQGQHPHSIVLAPAGDFAFAPNVDSNDIHQIVYDGDSGAMAPNEPALVTAPAGVGPRHLVFAADGRHAWVINESGDSITRWSYDALAGQLSSPLTVSTLPRGVDGTNNACADVQLGPGGAYLYGSNRGHDTLAMFTIDDRGALTWLGDIATEPSPRSFALAPGHRFLYAGGQGSGRLASYGIADDGTLQPLTVIDTPPSPNWVEPVELPG
jgi:6-phosphogluconolactonase (cycloisomerase 2 family)